MFLISFLLISEGWKTESTTIRPDYCFFSSDMATNFLIYGIGLTQTSWNCIYLFTKRNILVLHVTKRTPFRSTTTSFPRLSVANILFLEVLALQLVEDNLKEYKNLTKSNKIVTPLVDFNIGRGVSRANFISVQRYGHPKNVPKK